MRISDWSSDVCSSDLANRARALVATEHRDLFRRPLVPAELNRFGAIILDPPRPGAEEQVKQLAASAAPVIAHVSCNPASFARDATILVRSEARRVGEECVSTCSSRWSPFLENKRHDTQRTDRETSYNITSSTQ